MNWLVRVIVTVLGNLAGLLAAAYFVTGVSFFGSAMALLAVAAVLTLLNVLLKPMLKLIFGPVIFITFGLAIIVVNVIILFVLDILFQNLTIHGVVALVYTSLIVGIANLIAHALTRP